MNRFLLQCARACSNALSKCPQSYAKNATHFENATRSNSHSRISLRYICVYTCACMCSGQRLIMWDAVYSFLVETKYRPEALDQLTQSS
jgi:hypothetical protein